MRLRQLFQHCDPDRRHRRARAQPTWGPGLAGIARHDWRLACVLFDSDSYRDFAITKVRRAVSSAPLSNVEKGQTGLLLGAGHCRAVVRLEFRARLLQSNSAQA